MTDTLRPEHVASLQASGITAAEAVAAGIRSVDAAAVSDVVGFAVPSGGMLLPYPNCDAVRVRLDVPADLGNGKPAKYLSPRGAPVCVYVPPGVLDELRTDPARPLYVVEGEKKCLALRLRLGVSAVGVPGVWCWRSKARQSGVIEGFDELRPLLRGRPVVVVFDSDARQNLDVARAAFALAEWLRVEARARSSWSIPSHAIEGKVGVDDLLVRDGPDAVRELLATSIEPVEPVAFVLREKLARTPERAAAAPFVGTWVAEEFVALLAKASAATRAALAEEVQHALRLSASERSALRAAADKVAQDPTHDDTPNSASQGTALAFTDPDPWPESTDLAALLDDVRRVVRTYMVLPPHADVAVSLWIAFTWAFESFFVAPRLVVTSAAKRSGKTTLLLLLRALVRRPLLAANVTAAVVFRTIEAYRPTLLLDEWDSFAEGKEELRNVLNAGHLRDGVVLRVDGDQLEPRAFSAWGAAAVGAIGRVPDTLTDRSVEVTMRRKLRGETVYRLRGDRIARDLEPLRRKLARFAADAGPALADSDPTTPDALDDRASDNWRPLIAIADHAGGAWPERARDAAVALSAGRDAGENESLGVRLLADVRTAFGDADKVASADLVKDLVAMEDRPWAEVAKGDKPLTPVALARLLRPFAVSPRTIRLPGGDTAKGYLRETFADAWERYLVPTPIASVTPSQLNGQEDSKPVPNPSHDAAVTDRKSAPTSAKPLRVTASRLGTGEPADLDVGELFEERAGVREFDGGQTREEAERGAEREFPRGKP